MELRKANIKDAKLFFEWANDTSVRQNAINVEPIVWDNHVSWFKSKVISHDTFIYVLELKGVSIGQIRFDKINDKYLIDYSIDINHRRKGFGEKLIELGIQKMFSETTTPITIVAQVKEENLGSFKIFKKLGFVLFEHEIIKGIKYFNFAITSYKEKYLIVSEKLWNSDLLNNLKSLYSNAFFLAIKNKDYFNYDVIKTLNPTKIFLPHWSYIISEAIFKKYECIVFHMTDLPYGRGGSPLQNLIVKGHKTTKLSSIRVVKALDAGPIYLKKDLSLLGTAEEIFIRTNVLIQESISEIIKYNQVPVDQEGNVVLFKRRKPKDSSIKSITELESIFDHIRMLDAEGYPNAFFENDYFRFEFSRASLKADKSILADVRIIKK